MINPDNYKHSEITENTIRAFYKVYNALRYGFLEKVHENALYLELIKTDVVIAKQKQIKVFYEGEQVGVYFADLCIEKCVIVELKATETFCEEHEFQLINYLKATEIEVGLLLNFGKKPEFTQKVFSNKNLIKS